MNACSWKTRNPELGEILVLEYDFACTRTCTWEVNSWDLKCSIVYKKFVWFCILQGGTDTATKSTDSFFKRKCLFPYLNNTKKILSDNKSKVLLELDGFLCEEGLLFTKKTSISMFISTCIKIPVSTSNNGFHRKNFLSKWFYNTSASSFINWGKCLFTFFLKM